MSQPKIYLNSRDWDRAHKEKLARKYEKIQTLRALLEMHEANPDHDHDYILGLRARLRQAQNQFAAMSL